ncbi:rRNA maturation RNase YbeY [Candidatus Uhrbacteria bacterium]|nr:rRNA maturation RNase YbeY [Candidatus Uhrbacteria bacterium]
MITLDVNQEALTSDQQLAEGRFDNIVRLVNDSQKADGVIALRFVDEREIHKLNRMYRGKDSVTDVLSFSYMHDPGELLGDVAICYAQAERQAPNGASDEVSMLIVHGILHVLGYDHEVSEDAEKMFQIQDDIVDKVLVV